MVFSGLRVEFSSLRVRFLKYFYAWRVSLFLIGVPVSSRFANYSITGVYMDFITSEWKTPIYLAAMIINLKEAITSLFSIFGATYATHAVFGRYHAIRDSLLPFITGLGLFACAASVDKKKGLQIVLFCVSLLLTTIGEGMQKHTLFDFGYDQFEYQMEDEKKAKLQAQIWWNAGRLVGTVGGLIASTFLDDFGPKSMQNNWWLFGGILSTGLAVLTSIIYILGNLSFHKTRIIIVKSPILDVLKVIVATVRKRHLPYATDPSLIYDEGRNPTTELQQMTCTSNDTQRESDQTASPRNQFERIGLPVDPAPAHNRLKFLEKASIIESTARLDNLHEISEWRLCSLTKVRDAQLVLRLLPLWSTFVMFQVFKAMGDTFFLGQGTALTFYITDHSVDITLAILLAAQDGSQLLVGQVILPVLKRVARLKDGIPPLVRIGIGLFISILCCIVAGVVELRRLHDIVSNHTSSWPEITFFWLVPQCFLLGAAVGFAEDGISDFFDTRVPPNLRVCYRLTSESMKGVGCLFNSLIIAAVHLFSRLGSGDHWIGTDINTSKLHFFYFMIAGLSTMNLFLYYYISRKYAGSSQDRLPIISADHERPKEDGIALPTRQDDKKDSPDPMEYVSDCCSCC